MPGDLDYVRRIYDWWGAHSDLYGVMTRAVLVGSDRLLRDEAVASLRLREGDAVLDLACGPGPNLRRLTNAVGASGQVVALDYSGRMLDRARELAGREGWDQVEVVRAEAAHVPLPDSSLDGALCTLGLSAMPDPAAAIDEVYRCLRPGARFAILDAKPFERPWSVLNPLVKAVFVATTNWNTGIDLAAALERVFGNVNRRMVNGGSAFVAVAEKGARNPR